MQNYPIILKYVLKIKMHIGNIYTYRLLKSVLIFSYKTYNKILAKKRSRYLLFRVSYIDKGLIV